MSGHGKPCHSVLATVDMRVMASRQHLAVEEQMVDVEEEVENKLMFVCKGELPKAECFN